ncbi:ATP-binding protein [Brumicola nitratireducens]|uniref:histidine kinase n=1 Tax=Glaciecola nitratireducens (strain JCM 12485 / KCTC 12276 / FR1064) TaxID=1085623 RepID=G4QL73_GLANF|nr:ATP-binding protein [Glaciecola nitratireducens]AEP29544.1 sensor histidine kinase [Glaciecola nitratireducens FR1064]
MKSWSITGRIFLTCFLFVAIFFPAIIFSMQNAYERSLMMAKREELSTTAFAMISEFEFEEGEVVMPSRLFVEDLNLPGSDLVATIKWRDQQVWQSQSSIDNDIDSIMFNALYEQTNGQLLSETLFLSDFDENEQHFALSKKAEFFIDGNFEEVSFLVINNKNKYQRELSTFINRLWWWIAVLGLILLGLIALSLRSVFMPMQNIIARIGEIEEGKIDQINDDYPPELQPLQKSINKLLNSEKQQRERYKKSLDDLAHSIKTPLSIILGQSNLSRDIKEPVLHIDMIVKRQLKRATINVVGYLPSIDVAPVTQSLLDAMAKIHSQKSLSLVSDMPKPALLSIDQTDYMEILGNLLDNACKAATASVKVSYERNTLSTFVCVEDDGKGMSASAIYEITERGRRLDTYSEGQGLGLALVVDMLESYGGELQIQSDLNKGSRFCIVLPQQRFSKMLNK